MSFTPNEVLRGLSPDLVTTLARCCGASLDDLQVTFQLVPFGSRATMQAYELITMEQRRVVTVLPFVLEVIAAAAEWCAAGIERIRALHAQSRDDDGMCSHCTHDWPCATIIALDASMMLSGVGDPAQ